MGGYTENTSALAGIQYRSSRYAERVAREVADDMIDLCPVDTGLLASTIEVEATGDTVYVSVGTDYWQYVEFGTSRMPAQPFVRPALARRRNVVDLGGGL